MHHYEEFLDQTSPRHFLPLFPSMHTKMGVAPLVTKLHSSISKKKIIMIYLGDFESCNGIFQNERNYSGMNLIIDPIL